MARMGKATLRRHGDRNLVGRDQDWLAKLSIPGTILLFDSLEGRKLKVLAVHEGGDRGERRPVVTGHGFANRPRRDIGLIVDRQHEPLIVLLEMIISLGR